MREETKVSPPTRAPLSRMGALDRPWLASVILMTLGAVVVLLRLRGIAHGALSFFVVAGHLFVTGPPATTHVVVTSPGGYDGQFYYRLGIDPFELAHRAFGITVDSAYRFQRIGYPALSWVTSLGQIRWLAGAMIIVNIVSLGALALACALWARSFEQHALWGLLPAGFFGFVFTLARDLTEITAAAFVVGGIVAYRRQRPLACGFFLAAAMLTRETAGIVVMALALDQGAAWIRRRSWSWTSTTAWLVPIGAFAGWQVAVRLATGVTPLLSDQSSNIRAPFVAMIHDIATWPQLGPMNSFHEYASLASLLVVAVLAAISLRSSSSLGFEKLAFCLAVVVLVSLSRAAWNTDAVEFRIFADVWILGCGVLLGSSWRRMIAPSLVAATMWVVAAHMVVTSI